MEAQAIFSGFKLSVYNTRTQIPSLVNPIHHLSPSSPISTPPVLGLRRYITTSCSAHHDHGHHQQQQNGHRHDHNHHHHHHHHHGSNEYDDGQLTKPQQLLLKFADSIRWTHLASFLREHLELCCCSAALFIAAAACPYVLPKPAVKPLQHVFAAIAFPLVGISASLDALLDIAGGKINIHMLMALAAFASVFMGNSLEGGLLLAMFNLSHIAEEYFTSCSKIDVKELKENHPKSALLLDVNNGSPPSFSDLTYHEVPVSYLKVGSTILVKAGESVPVDCEVLRGSSTITVEHLIGEAKKTWKESTLSRIMQLTEEAQLSKSKLQRWLDKFGEQYSKVVILLSISVAVIGPFLFRGSIYRALGLMVAASPCALAVAPVAYVTAISACARKAGESARRKQRKISLDLGFPMSRLPLHEVTLFHFEVKPRPGVSNVIRTLHDQGKLHVMMLTGDHEASARRDAKAVGITEVHFGLKPEDKLYHVTRTSRDTGGLIMVGDGINDAPALANATIGILFAERVSVYAIAVSDVLLLQDNISGVPFCVAKSRQTMSLIKQNVALALSSIAFASLTSVLGFLPLWLTVLLHEGGMLLVWVEKNGNGKL